MAEDELREWWRTTPHPDRFGPGHRGYEQAMAAHEAAVEAGLDGYIDPTSGLFVLTATALAARPCCEQGCRHCPWITTAARKPAG